MKYYKNENIAIKYDDKTKESKVSGKITDISGELALEVIQLGDEITKEEYDAI
jgi:hypothetical protein